MEVSDPPAETDRPLSYDGGGHSGSQPLYVHPDQQDDRQSGRGLCQQCESERAFRGAGSGAEKHGRISEHQKF